MVTKEAFLARAQDGRVKAFAFDGMDLYVRRLGLDERIAFGDRARAGDEAKPHEYLAAILCQEDGTAWVTAEEMQAWCAAHGELAESLVKIAYAHAGLIPTEDAAKN